MRKIEVLAEQQIVLTRRRLRELNERNAVFHAERSKTLKEQLTRETLENALRQRASEVKRGIPLKNWSFEEAVADAVERAKSIKARLARLVGSNKKTDALQELIIEIARNRLQVTFIGPARTEPHGVLVFGHSRTLFMTERRSYDCKQAS